MLAEHFEELFNFSMSSDEDLIFLGQAPMVIKNDLKEKEGKIM